MLTAASAMLIARMTPEPENEAEFNAWYDTEHLADLLRLPGFLGAQRWVDVETPRRYLASYYLHSLEALRTPEYQSAVGTSLSPWSKRMIALAKDVQMTKLEQVFPEPSRLPPTCGAMMLVTMDVDPDHEAELNKWYNEEHLPRLLGVDGVLDARRFRARSGSPKYYAFYYLEKLEVFRSSPWQVARTTPWSDKVRAYFKSDTRRLYRPA